jgi:hypothetical protein
MILFYILEMRRELLSVRIEVLLQRVDINITIFKI